MTNITAPKAATRIRRVALAVITGGTAFCLGRPANALPPEHYHFEESGSDPHFIQCDGFEIGLDTTGTFDVTVYFDSGGDVVKFLVAVRATDILTNSVTGATVVNRGVFEELFQRIDDTEEFTHALAGFRFMGTTPGEGLVLQDVGRIVYSPGEEQILFLAGQHKVPDAGLDAAFCAALS